MTYLIFYDNEDFVFVDAENIEDCIIQMADYTGDNSDLFLKALKGCRTSKDYVNMYNHFSNYDINSIFILKETVYEKEEMNLSEIRV